MDGRPNRRNKAAFSNFVALVDGTLGIAALFSFCFRATVNNFFWQQSSSPNYLSIGSTWWKCPVSTDFSKQGNLTHFASSRIYVILIFVKGLVVNAS